MLEPLFFSAIVWCVMENKGYDEVRDLPSSRRLAAGGAVLEQSYGMVHPSGPNYRLMVAGETFAAGQVHDRPEPNVARAWAGLGIPTRVWYPCATPAIKHDPYRQLEPGLVTHRGPFDPERLPARCQVYLGFDPRANGHDGARSEAVGCIDRTLTRLLDTLDRSTWFHTPDPTGRYPVFLVTYDESFRGDQHIFTAFYGQGVRPGYRSPVRYDHLSLCRTLTDNWKLPPLGQAGQAAPISDVWRVPGDG